MDDIVEQLRALETEARNFPNPEHGDSEIYVRLKALKKSRAQLFGSAADLIDRQREEIGRLHRCGEQAARDIEVLGLGFRDAALRVRTALSDTTREGLGAATPKTAQHHGCSEAGEDGNE